MQVQIFPNNVVEPEDQCNLDCIQRASDAEGIATFEVPRRARLAYRVLPQTGPDAAATFLRTVEYGFLWPDDPEMTEWFNTISLGVMDGLVVSAGNMRDRQRAVLSGRVLDCQDRPVSAAWVRVFDEEGQEIEGRAGAFGGPQILYFDGLVPPSLDVEAEYTAADGRWAAANIAEGAVRVEAWARLDPGADPVLVACEAFTTFPDSLIVGGLRPWRETMPAACGERPPSP